MTSSTLPEILANASATRWGIALSTSDPVKLRAALYAELKRQRDKGLQPPDYHLSIKDGEVWVRERRPQPPDEKEQPDGEAL
jgi:hypothetical protein